MKCAQVRVCLLSAVCCLSAVCLLCGVSLASPCGGMGFRRGAGLRGIATPLHVCLLHACMSTACMYVHCMQVYCDIRPRLDRATHTSLTTHTSLIPRQLVPPSSHVKLPQVTQPFVVLLERVCGAHQYNRINTLSGAWLRDMI